MSELYDYSEKSFRGDAVGAVLIALAATIRLFSKAPNLPLPVSFQTEILGILDDNLGDFGPGKPEHDPSRWDQMMEIRGILQYVLENPVLQLYDPSEGPPN